MAIETVYLVYNKFMVASMGMIVFGCFLLFRGTKEKAEFPHIEGNITYLDSKFEELPIRQNGKFRYISIDRFPKTFELFIGKDYADFSPQFEKIDELKTKDKIVIYLDDDTDADLRLNRSVQFIDKEGKPFFIRGNKDKYGGIFFIGLSIVSLMLTLYLKKTGRII